MKFYDFKARKMNGQEVSMEDYKGKVVLVVNTASVDLHLNLKN